MTGPRTEQARAGILLYSAGIFLFAVNDALGKWLVADYGVAQIMALRGLGAILVLAPVLWLAGARFAGPLHGALQALRVTTSAVDTFCFYAASRTLPLADVMTFYLAAPLIVVALSRLVLGEAVGPRRWTAVVVGFIGVLIALRPSGAVLSPGALVALLGSLMFASTLTLTRHLRDVPALELVAVQVAGQALLGAAIAPFDWVSPPPGDLGLMALVGVVSMACLFGITRALSLASASRLAPLQYLSIVWAAIMGWLVWGDVPSSPIVLGSAVIIASGLVVLRREAVVAPV